MYNDPSMYNYYNPGMMSPQQRQMMQNQAYGLMNYNAPVNTPGSGVGQMATSIMNGLFMNPSLQGVFNRNQNQAAAAGLMGATPPGAAPMQLQGGGNTAGMGAIVSPNPTTPVGAPMNISPAMAAAVASPSNANTSYPPINIDSTNSANF
jgi:hypothetical protein